MKISFKFRFRQSLRPRERKKNLVVDAELGRVGPKRGYLHVESLCYAGTRSLLEDIFGEVLFQFQDKDRFESG